MKEILSVVFVSVGNIVMYLAISSSLPDHPVPIYMLFTVIIGLGTYIFVDWSNTLIYMNKIDSAFLLFTAILVSYFIFNLMLSSYILSIVMTAIVLIAIKLALVLYEAMLHA